MEKIKILELFGGIGAPRKALENLGYKIESDYVEIDEHATRSYNAIYNENNTPISVTDFHGTNKSYDLLFHGSPCQDFSLAGKMRGGEKGTGTRSSLMWETVRIVEECQPPVVVWENVKNVVSKKNIETFNKYLEKLETLGYANYYEVLNAKNYGMPQNRERVFVVSLLNKEFNFTFPKKQKLEIQLKDLLEANAGNEYIIDQELKNKIVIEDIKQIKIKNATKMGYAIACDGDGIDLNYPTSKTRRGRVQNGLAHTLTTQGNLAVLQSGEIRKLTPLECWRLMGFEDEDFHKASQVNSNSQLYKQAGNSIVVNVLEALFKEILSDQVLDLKSLCENKDQLQTSLF